MASGPSDHLLVEGVSNSTCTYSIHVWHPDMKSTGLWQVWGPNKVRQMTSLKVAVATNLFCRTSSWLVDRVWLPTSGRLYEICCGMCGISLCLPRCLIPPD